MAEQIAFEVYVQRGPRWELTSRYDAAKQSEALREAHNLERQPFIDAVRVVREIYRGPGGLTEEHTVYRSDRPQGSPSREAAWPRTGHNHGASALPRAYRDFRRRARTQRRAAPPQPPTPAALLLKILVIGLVAFGCATALTALGASYIPITRSSQDWLDAETRQNLLLIIFLLTFCGTSLAIGRALLSRADMADLGVAGRDVSVVRRQPPAPPPAIRRQPSPGLPPLAEAPREDDAATADAASETAAAPAPDPQTKVETKAKDAAVPEEGTPGPLGLAAFLRACLAEGPADDTLTNADRFGVNLFLAGAAEALANRQSWDADTEGAALREALEQFGLSSPAAAGFVARKDEYVLSSAGYMQMYVEGRAAMNAALDNDSTYARRLADALAARSAPQKREAFTGPISVMFTRLGSGDDDTPDMFVTGTGDAEKQEAMRAHNQIVREVLKLHGGREVKHTGDGIMASFERTSDALAAAAGIQRQATAKGAAGPRHPLPIRIGINAGEPIREDNDLFGTTVQLAARIAGAAPAGRILVSNTVRGLCVGQTIPFRPAGDFALKGFPEPVPLFEVAWQDGADGMAGAAA